MHLIPLVARAVPRVAPVRGVLISSAAGAAFVLIAPSAAAIPPRLRVGAAVVAATAACVLDDEAASTLAGAPVALATRRGVRIAAVTAFLVVWFAVVAVAADALHGTGGPTLAAYAEVLALELIALAVACLAIDHTDDGRGGIAGTIVALMCFTTVYAPSRWWWPLAARPETRRSLVLALVAAAAAAWASADPARRRRWTR